MLNGQQQYTTFCQLQYPSLYAGQCIVFSTTCWLFSAQETFFSSSATSLQFPLHLARRTLSSTCSTWWPSVAAILVFLSASSSPSVSPSRDLKSYFSISLSASYYISRLCASLLATPTIPGDMARPSLSPPTCCPPWSWPSSSTSPGYWRYLLQGSGQIRTSTT